MTGEQWERLKPIFHDALDQPAHARSAWLVHACGGDEALLREAESMLRAHETAGDFLVSSVVFDPADLLEPSEPSEPIEPFLKPGTSVGTYEILEEIARGGMGIVYLARDTRLGRLVALKALPAAFANRADLRERLRREARAAATITHPSVATIYALEEFDGHLLLISEYVRGPTLRSLIDRGPMDADHARAIAIDIARALEAAHRAGVIHRDLKPENVIISEGGGAKVVDFGIARLEGAPMTRLTRAGAMLGTPAYMAPEQLLGNPVDNRTDIFAFGLLLIEMLSGRHPMDASSPSTDREREHRTADSGLATIANRCAQADPAARYESAHDLLRDLESGTASAPTTAASASRRKLPVARNPARWWWEFHQGVAAIAYIAMLFPVWRARGLVGGLPGRAIFILAAAAVIVTALLRWHLWFTSRFYPEELASVRAHAGRWIHGADWLFVLSLVAGALLVGDRSALDVVLISMAIGASVAFLVIEPVTARAAFGGPDRT